MRHSFEGVDNLSLVGIHALACGVHRSSFVVVGSTTLAVLPVQCKYIGNWFSNWALIDYGKAFELIVPFITVVNGRAFVIKWAGMVRVSSVSSTFFVRHDDNVPHMALP